MSNDSVLEAQIDTLSTATLETLQRQWKILCRKPYPAHLSRSLVVTFIAYRLQAARYGDLDSGATRYLNSIASADGGASQLARFAAEKVRYSPGTVFVRGHDGQLHQAVQTVRGFEWNGQEFRSLSAVARAITGTSWNGLRFFGVPRAKENRDA